MGTGAMDAAEGGAGRVATAFFDGLTSRGRRWAMLLGLAAFVLAGLTGLFQVSVAQTLTEDRETFRILAQDGTETVLPVIGVIWNEEGRGAPDKFVVVEVPPGGEENRVRFNVTRLADRRTDVGDRIPVVYSSSRPSVAVPAAEYNERSPIRLGERQLKIGWGVLAASLLLLSAAIVLWRRSDPGGHVGGDSELS